VLATTYTHSDGTFELYNMASGRYMLVAQQRSAQASEFVSANGMLSQVELRMRKCRPNRALGQLGDFCSSAENPAESARPLRQG
jgi:hypothetical protein